MKILRKPSQILGYNVDCFSFEQALEYAVLSSGQIVTINPEMIMNAQKDKHFSKVLSEAELVLADGVGVEIGLKLLGVNCKRIPGVEFGQALLREYSQLDKSVAFIGAKSDIVNKAVENMKKMYPQLNVVYIHDGYFNDAEQLYEQLEKVRPDLILVALGSPKQEFFIYNLKERLPNSLMIGLGGSFDVWAGAVKRAPVLFQKIGMEWFYRTVLEPKRLKRIFPTLPLFILKVLKERSELNVK